MGLSLPLFNYRYDSFKGTQFVYCIFQFITVLINRNSLYFISRLNSKCLVNLVDSSVLPNEKDVGSHWKGSPPSRHSRRRVTKVNSSGTVAVNHAFQQIWVGWYVGHNQWNLHLEHDSIPILEALHKLPLPSAIISSSRKINSSLLKISFSC